MSEDRNFLARWSRRKHQAAREVAKPAQTPAPKAAEQPAAKPPELPPVDSLGLDSDFSAYLAANVEESVKRAALKKLFADPRFNVMDGLDVYIDDYTKLEAMPEEMLAKLEQARSAFEGLKEQAKADPKEEVKEEIAKREEEDSEGTRGNPGQDA